MEQNSWFSNWKQKRKLKQEQKAKEKFGFLLDAVNEYNGKITAQLNQIGNHFENTAAGLSGQIANLESQLRTSENNVISSVREILLKQEMISDSLQTHTQSIQQETALQIKELNQQLELLKLTLNQISKSGIESRNQIAEALETQAGKLSSSIDEAKKLVELLAVNELIDEIRIGNEMNSAPLKQNQDDFIQGEEFFKKILSKLTF